MSGPLPRSILNLFAAFACCACGADMPEDNPGPAPPLRDASVADLVVVDGPDDALEADSPSVDAHVDALDAFEAAAQDTSDARDSQVDAGLALPAVVTEVAHPAGTLCNAPALFLSSPGPSSVLAVAIQIPDDDVPGSCVGHTASAFLRGSTLQILLEESGGSACQMACWDFWVHVSDVPPGTYDVHFSSLSSRVSVN